MIARLVIAWLGVIPLALVAALTVRIVAWKVLGYYVVPSLMLVAYIWGAIFWSGMWKWAQPSPPLSKEERTP